MADCQFGDVDAHGASIRNMLDPAYFWGGSSDVRAGQLP